MWWSDEHGSICEGPDPSSGLGSNHSTAFYAPKHKIQTHTGLVWNADPVLISGSVVWCHARFVYSHGTRAKADVRIRTLGSRSASHIFNCVQYRLKIPKSPEKSPDSHVKWTESVNIFLKTNLKIFLKLPGETWTRIRILRSGPVKNSSKREKHIILDPDVIQIRKLD